MYFILTSCECDFNSFHSFSNVLIFNITEGVIICRRIVIFPLDGRRV
jgi:hypothetical protein